VVIDPSYEEKSDYEQVVRTIERAHRKWSTGGYLVWYPLLPAGLHHTLLEQLKDSGIRKILRSEWRHTRASMDRGLYGSGVIWINSPWKADDTLRSLGDWLMKVEFGSGPSVVEWLTEE